MAQIPKTSATGAQASINGSTGDDQIIITNGSSLTATNTINGGAGNDTIIVGNTNKAAQTFNFGANVTNIEAIVVGFAQESLQPNNVAHKIDASKMATATTIIGNDGNNVISAGTANDTVVGNGGNDTLNGNAGNDSINGGIGNDVINGGAGTDTLLGGEGNDVFMVTLGSEVTIAERINGGDGNDQIRFANTGATNNVLTLNGNVQVESVVIGTGVGAVANTTGTTAQHISASFVNSALSITGNAGTNRIIATSYDDTITGGKGADTLSGGNGDDTYVYTTGDFAKGETITDANGYDTVRYDGTGVLKLTAAVTGIDAVVINEFPRVAGGVDASALLFNNNSYGGGIDIFGNGAANSLTGTAFDDLFYGGAGNDTINGGAGNDVIKGELGADTLNGGLGNDTIFGESADSINGGTNPVVTGPAIQTHDAENDVLVVSGTYVQANNARLLGIETIEIKETYNEQLDEDVGGIVRLTGQTEAFTVVGSFENDSIVGGNGNDLIYDTEINQYGGGKYGWSSDNDYDTLVGGAGNDIIYAGSYDSIDGGIGNDTLVVSDNFYYGADADLKGVEVVTADDREVQIGSEPIFSQYGGVIGYQPVFGEMNTQIDLSSQTEAFVINGNNGNNFLAGGAGADTINAGNGVDTIYINAVADYTVGDVIDGGDQEPNGGFGPRPFGGPGGFYGGDTIVIDVDYADADQTIQLVNVSNIENVIIDSNGINLNVDASLVFAPLDTNDFYGSEDVRTDGLYIQGNSGDNFIAGTELNDTIMGGYGSDIIDGGNDVSFFNKQLRGFGSYGDTVVYSGDIEDYAIENRNGVFTILDKFGNNDIDTVVNVESFVFDGAFYTADDLADSDYVTVLVRGEDKDVDNLLLASPYGSGSLFDAGAGDDTMYGGNGDDFYLAGEGDDVIYTTIGDDYDTIIGGDGTDTVYVNASVTTSGYYGETTYVNGEQIRVSFVSAEVGNGDAYYGGNDERLAVTIQAEDIYGGLVGNQLTADDEGTVFVAASGKTFDVRDIITGAERGDDFDVVVLGTEDADTFNSETLVITNRPTEYLNYYVNAGMGDDVVETYYGADFLVGGAGNDSLSGGYGDDSFIGGAGDDVINGGYGGDFDVATVTLSYGEVLDASDIVEEDGAFVVTTSQGVDTYTNIDQLVAGQNKVLFVGNGGYESIQDAIDSAAEGDTIVVGAGTYSGDITVNVANLTIVGAQKGVAGNAEGRDGTNESTVYGRINITAAGVTLDGLMQELDVNNRFGSTSGEGIRIGAADVTITNTVVLRSGGELGDIYAGIRVQGSGAEVTDNYIANPGALAGGFSGAQVGISQGIYGDVEASEDMYLDGNVIHNVRTGLSVDYISDETVISNNTVTASGSGTAVGFADDYDFTANYTGNDFDLVAGGTTFNFQNVTQGVTFDASENSNTGSLGGIDTLLFLGSRSTSSGDNFTGTTGVDIMAGQQGNDTLDAGAGADSLIGGVGADYIYLGDEDGAADVVTQNLLDGVSMTFTSVDMYGGALGDGDTFSYAYGAGDVINEFENDTDLLSFGNTTLNDDTFYGSSIEDNDFDLIRGSYNAETGVFTVALTAGFDTLVVYDANSAQGSVDMRGVVVTGIVPADLLNDLSVSQAV